jgi:23S rRNA-/tRNA-specific pseudouridylate synthase
LQSQFAGGLVDKCYLARVAVHPEGDEFSCDAPISRQASTAGVRLIDENGVDAHTTFEVVERFDDGTALVCARPLTGRTNQIRLHLWSLGMPIVGDPTYGADGRIVARQSLAVGDPPMCLHAWKIAFQHPHSGERVAFEAAAPAWGHMTATG